MRVLGKEWLPVHRLRECRRRSSGHDGAEHCDGKRPRSCQHKLGRDRQTAGRTAGRTDVEEKKGADGTVKQSQGRMEGQAARWMA